MSKVFVASTPGRIIYAGDEARGAQFTIKAPGYTASIRALVSGVTIQQRTASQFQKSLDRSVYVTSFGDELASISLDVVLATATCQTAAGDSASIDGFLSDYKANRLTPDTTASALVTIGATAFRAFLVASNLTLSGMSGMPSYTGRMEYVGWLA